MAFTDQINRIPKAAGWGIVALLVVVSGLLWGWGFALTALVIVAVLNLVTYAASRRNRS